MAATVLVLPAAKGVTVEVFSAPGGPAPSLAQAFAQAERDAPPAVGAGAP